MIDLETLRLEKGAHDDCGGGQGPVCLLEAVACYVGGSFTDHPETTSPVLAAFGRVINDAMPDDRRQELKQFIPQLVGTAGNPDLDRRRAFMLTDWAVRIIAPGAFRAAAETLSAAGLTEQATIMEHWASQLEALSPISNESAARVAESAGRAARVAARAAWAAESAAWAGQAAARAGRAAKSGQAAKSAEAAAVAARAAAESAGRAAIWDECIRFFDVLLGLR